MQVVDEHRQFLLDTATKAAASTQGSIADVFRKTKSQTFLFQKLKEHFPDASHAELRALIERTRLEHANDPAWEVAHQRPTRPPNRGREPINDPAWDERLTQLRALIDVPMTTAQLKNKAALRLGWDQSFFQAAIAASDGRGILEYQPPHWMPAPTQETRRVPKPSRVKIRKVQRSLECLLPGTDLEVLTKRIDVLHAQKGHVHAELQEKLSEIRARHRAEAKELTSILRAELGRVTRERELLLTQRSQGVVHRDVECEERLDYEARIVSLTRLDTQDIVERRPMGPDEVQMEIEGA